MLRPKFHFIDRTLFFPEKGILVVGDLHLGYDYMLRQSGVLIPERQIKETIEDLETVFAKIESSGFRVRKMIFLGDIKHSFSYEFQEKSEFYNILEFLERKLPRQKIIFIRGNHDTIDYTFGDMKDYYVEDNVAFIHGHKTFPEIFDKKIRTIVTGHLHPSVTLAETPGVKKEEYKCFLRGSYKRKTFFVVPSFLSITPGSAVNIYSDYDADFSIIPSRALRQFEVYVVGANSVYDFGKVKDLS